MSDALLLRHFILREDAELLGLQWLVSMKILGLAIFVLSSLPLIILCYKSFKLVINPSAPPILLYYKEAFFLLCKGTTPYFVKGSKKKKPFFFASILTSQAEVSPCEATVFKRQERFF